MKDDGKHFTISGVIPSMDSAGIPAADDKPAITQPIDVTCDL